MLVLAVAMRARGGAVVSSDAVAVFVVVAVSVFGSAIGIEFCCCLLQRCRWSTPKRDFAWFVIASLKPTVALPYQGKNKHGEQHQTQPNKTNPVFQATQSKTQNLFGLRSSLRCGSPSSTAFWAPGDFWRCRLARAGTWPRGCSPGERSQVSFWSRL